MAVKSKTSDERKARARYVDQPGQWEDRTPAATKRRQAKAWTTLETMMKKGKKK